MSVTYLKKSSRTAETGHQDVQTTVQSMLDELEQGGEEIACHLARKFDHWDGDILVSPEALESAKRAKLKDDIRFAQDSIQRFAEAQKTTISEVSVRANHLSFGDQP
jgi:sulfopropanediol 3-dehydrogenase